MRFREKLKAEYENSILNKWEIASAFLILACITLTMYYADITVTSQFSLIFIDSLFDGRMASFYNNALSSGIAPEGAVYDVGLYIVFAIWGLPVWLFNKIIGINVLGTVPLLWFKLLLIVFSLGTIYLLKKIAKCLGFDERIRKYIGWTYTLSLAFVFPVLVVAQYDIIPVFFILYGIWKWLEGNRKKWLVGFAVAFTMKPFAILIFAVMLFMQEKKVLRILAIGATSMIPLGICKVVYLLNPLNNASNNNFFNEMFPKLLATGFSCGNGQVSVFFLILFIIYIMAYSYSQEEESLLKGRQFIWLAFLMWAAFCMFTDINPYWIVYLAPFMSIIVFYNISNINLLLILELIINIGTTVLMIIRYPWVYGGQKTFAYLVLQPLYEVVKYENISTAAGVINALNLTQLQPIISSAVLGSIVASAVLSYKGMNDKKIEQQEAIIYPWHMRVRILILYGWMVMCLLLLLPMTD